MKKKASDICIGIVGAGIMGSGHALYISESVKGARVAGIYDASGRCKGSRNSYQR